ncbi:DUF92 domain-containing protein [Heliorestis convoluta]|uniref:DUF92 domain-containing protein n=1 Tax=Heliorestis convoluta TaxID=356322 RepID=A0A5Q2N036_9FIRM|nr:DUF92 domain-containing protein [Heliorestis convoluta]QGG48368.1 hypothetical protein FTV88_2270 [Heliorestis convoluta]
MSYHDLIGLFASYAYVFGLLILATLVQKWRNYPAEFTRKIVHIGAGMWIVGAVLYFESYWIGLIPIASFIVLNYISYRYRLVKAMDLSGDSPGTVYFALSITLLLLFFWPQDQAYIAVAAVMAMTWGDAFAAILGRAYGKRPYLIRGHRRTFEGSLVMFGLSFIVIALTLFLMGNPAESLYLNSTIGSVESVAGSALSSAAEASLEVPMAFVLSTVLGFSLIAALVATFLEAISLKGLDNVAVPVGTAFTLWGLIHLPFPLPWAMLFLGLILSAIIAFIAYRRRSLSASGVFGALLVGTLIFGFGGLLWGLTLVAFFVYGSALSTYREDQKAKVAADKFDKGSRRDFGQALANGGFGAVLALLYYFQPLELWLFAAFIGTMATVNADTWATEIGVLSKKPPRLITTGKVVAPGTSGGITMLGTAAVVLGGFVIGLTVWIFTALPYLFGALFGLGSESGTSLLVHVWSHLAGHLWIILAGIVGGLGGSMADSYLGATVQAMYIDAETGQETEKKTTRSGKPNRFHRGWPFMTNDMVNFVSSIVGAALAAAVVFPFL